MKDITLENEIRDAKSFLYFYLENKSIIDQIDFKKSKIKQDGSPDFYFKEINILLEIKTLNRKLYLDRKLFNNKNSFQMESQIQIEEIKKLLKKSDKQLNYPILNKDTEKIFLIVNQYKYLFNLNKGVYIQLKDIVKNYNFINTNKVFFQYRDENCLIQHEILHF
jgi:hypothetical protein